MVKIETNTCKNIIFIKQRGNHKSSYYKLIYNSGSYAELQAIQDDNILYNTVVNITCNDGDIKIYKYAIEHGFKEVKQ